MTKPEQHKEEFNQHWRQLDKIQSEQKELRKSELKKKLSESTLPLPQHIIFELSSLFITDFIDVMRSHAGFALAGC